MLALALRQYFVYNSFTTHYVIKDVLSVTYNISDIDPLLDGFEAVPSDSVPFITLDSQRRFYINASLRRLIDIKPHERLALAYNATTKTLAVLTGASATLTSSVSSYFVDKRYYMSARRFCAEYRYTSEGAPYTFEFQRAGTAEGVYLFVLTGE